ncbi:GatB/YqeY domain-containing protein [Magnetofaba australis]|uniref:Putative GatB/Yqey domain-containing protein n=1 Tax=Magnetofaba australis IT-1 TaxID=1434232 RepID=A0A1Y2K8K8_9PROT|nr:GatB/YqeY domain-containing protein [Magnetofaba australis]OSM07078.1 putative GatB/Yqey domain-containing protein [Magnetofaba australis IT-1]
MTISQRISDDLKTAMRAKDSARTGALRMLRAAILNEEKSGGKAMTEADAIRVVRAQIKQRRDSAEAFRNAGREESADKELGEIAVLEEYLPPALSEEQMSAIVDAAIAAAGAASIKEMGKVMGQLKGSVPEGADMGALSALVKKRLAGA